MRTWTKSAGLLFMAAASVYADPATTVNAVGPATPAPAEVTSPAATDAVPQVRVLDETPGPANGVSPADAPVAVTSASEPTTQPAAVEPVAPQGTSISKDEVNVSDAGTVEIHVNEANLVEVLRMLSLQSQRNIIASKEVQGVVTANLYDVTVQEALDAILKANGFGYKEKGNFIYVYTAKEIAEMEKADRKLTSEVFRLFYTPAANAQNMLKPVLSADGQVAYTQPAASGIQSGTADAGGNSHADDDYIVVTDYPENLDKVRGLLKEIDRRPQQILIEATILRAALTNDNTLGVDFNFLGGVDFTRITESSGQFLGSSIANSSSGTGGGTGGTGGGTGGTAGNGPAWTPNATAVGTGNNFTQGGNGFRIGVVGNDFSVFLQALETVTNTTVMANPKILALNKQRGEVIVGRKDGYYTTTVTENATVQTVEFLETGTRLVFRPYVGDDGYVRMEVHPEDSSGGLNASNLPFKVTTEVTSNVLVKDGHTIVIGGLFREVSSSTTNQVPFLGSLPLAGYLFRKQNDNTNREEVIILLTPHVIKDQGEYAAESERLMKDADKLRVGVRKGMMPFSRTRLAEISYDQARAELDKADPNRGKAMFYLNVATGLDPLFPEALALKESVTGEELTGVNHSLTREFLRKQVLAERVRATTRPADVRSLPLRSERETTSAAATPAQLPLPAVTETASPTTRPAAATEEVVTADHPSAAAIEEALAATSPSHSEAAPVVPAVAPTTQPTAVEPVELVETPLAPTTQPADAPETAVTELPGDEVAPD